MSRTKTLSAVRRFHPALERLEDRTTPAGNVAAAIIGGNLFVVGDGAANRVVIGQWGSSQIALASLDGSTTINGAGFALLGGFDGSAYISMGAGNDVLSLIGVNPDGDLVVDMGAGDDNLWMTAVTGRRATFLTGGAGGDIVNFISSSFGGGLVSTSFEGKASTPVVTAKNDTGTVAEAGVVDIDVAANDKVSIGKLDLTSIVITSDPTNGDVVANDDGTVTYTHDGSETTTDSFQYTISDNKGNVSKAATVTITITPVNDPPIAVADTGTVDEGGTVSINVVGNDTDTDGTINKATVMITTGPANGTALANADGTVTYKHDGTETITDTFKYKVQDDKGAFSNEATVTVTITPVNDAPTAVDDTATVAEGGNLNIPVMANDTDPEGKLDLATIVITVGPTNGTATKNADGTVTYTHDGSETTTDTFKYKMQDQSGAFSNEATVTVTITPANDPPTAGDDTSTVDEGATGSIDVAANDTDIDGTLKLDSIVITTGPTNGTATPNVDGTVTYKHDGGETTTDTFKYKIQDDGGAFSNEATVTITITPVNDPPIAIGDGGTADEGGSVIIDVAANDTDPDSTLNLGSIVITSGPANGTATPNVDGTVTYKHDGSETTSDTFTYKIQDAQGAFSNEATVTIVVNPINDAPTAVDDTGTVDEGGTVIIDLAANDTDPEGALLLDSIVIKTMPTNGTLTVNTDGTVKYEHNGSETTTDTFSYTITDDSDTVSNEAIVTITINPVNDAPTAVDDTFTVTFMATTNLDLAVNDNDPEGKLDLGSINITLAPAHGTLTVNTDGTVDYLHDGSVETTDTFAYTIEDTDNLLSNEATVNITITGGP